MGSPGTGQYAMLFAMVAKPDAAFATASGDAVADGARARPSFEAAYREHFAFVWRTARRMAVREAHVDDVVQDAFLVLYRKLSEYDGRTSMRGYLYGILVRVVADHRRRGRRKDAPVRSIDEDERGAERFAAESEGPDGHAERGEAVALLETLLAKLSAEHREVLVLSRLEEMSVPEIAECLGANVNTVYSRLRVASERFDALYADFRAAEERNLAR